MCALSRLSGKFQPLGVVVAPDTQLQPAHGKARVNGGVEACLPVPAVPRRHKPLRTNKRTGDSRAVASSLRELPSTHVAALVPAGDKTPPAAVAGWTAPPVRCGTGRPHPPSPRPGPRPGARVHKWPDPPTRVLNPATDIHAKEPSSTRARPSQAKTARWPRPQDRPYQGGSDGRRVLTPASHARLYSTPRPFGAGRTAWLPDAPSPRRGPPYSTVTLLARFRGLSTSRSSAVATS